MISEAVKLEREHRKTVTADRAWQLVSDPAFTGALVAVGGIMAVQKLRFSADDSANEDLRALATAAVVLIGTSRAGLGGTASALLAAGAGFASSGETVQNLTGTKGFWNFLLGSDKKLFGLSIPGVS